MDDAPLIAEHPEIAPENALQGFDGVRAFSADPSASRALLDDALGFSARDSQVWRPAARPVAASTSPATSRRSSGVSAAPEPSTTSPGRRRWKTTKRGELGSRALGLGLRRSSVALVPLDLLPRAERCPLRVATLGPVSASTRMPSTSARDSSSAGVRAPQERSSRRADTDSRPAHVGPHRR